MTFSKVPARGRPHVRNEIFRGGLLGGADPSALVADFGTPLFVYDLRTIDRQAQTARAQFDGRRFELAFSVKANPSLAIIGHMRSLGLGLCVCSAGELDIGRQVGFAGPSITFVGPAKSAEELTAAAAHGVVVSVESPDELRQLSAIATRHRHARERRASAVGAGIPAAQRGAHLWGLSARQVRHDR